MASLSCTVTVEPIIRPAILRTFERNRPDENGNCTADVVDKGVLVHMLGGIRADGTYIVEYEDGTLHHAKLERLSFTDNMHAEYRF